MAKPRGVADAGVRATLETGSSSGFTLIELLVAAAITVIVAALALTASGRALEQWTQLSGRERARHQARAILDRLALDLQAAMAPPGSGVWLAVSVSDDQGPSGLWETAPREKPAGSVGGSLRMDAEDFSSVRFGRSGAWVRFFAGGAGDSPGPDFDGLSLPAAISWQIIRRRDPDGAPNAPARYLLHRSLVRPAESSNRPGILESGWDLNPAAATAYTEAGPLNDGSTAGDPFSVQRPAAAENVFAADVIDFGVRLLARADAGGWTPIFPAGTGGDEYLLRSPVTGEPIAAGADLMVRVLTPEGARGIALLESGGSELRRPEIYADDAAWWWGIAEANSVVMTRRIDLPAMEE